MTCIKYIITGRVQGVFFRESTRREAESLDVTGHAINLSDGSVEVIACGEQSNLQKFLLFLHQGPEHARVDSVVGEEINIRVPDTFNTR